MGPYNGKLLGVSLEKLRPDYAGRFIRRPSLGDVLKGALVFWRESLSYNARFVYARATTIHYFDIVVRGSGDVASQHARAS